MEAYLEDNRPTMDEVCASNDECNEECPCYVICFPPNNTATCFVSKTSHNTATTVKEAYELGKKEGYERSFKGMTNGEVIMALFPNGKFDDNEDGDCKYEIQISKDYSFCSWFDSLWWNVPYEREVE